MSGHSGSIAVHWGLSDADASEMVLDGPPLSISLFGVSIGVDELLCWRDLSRGKQYGLA